MELIKYTTDQKSIISKKVGIQTTSSIKINIKNVENRIDKLTDMVLDGTLEQETYLVKKEQLFKEKSVLLERQKVIQNKIKSNIEQKTRTSLEQSQSLCQLYKLANMHERRSLLKKTFSNIVLTGGRLLIVTNKPYSMLLNSPTVLSCCQEQGSNRDRKEDFSPEEIVKIAEAFIEQAITEC